MYPSQLETGFRRGLRWGRIGAQATSLSAKIQAPRNEIRPPAVLFARVEGTAPTHTEHPRTMRDP